MYLKGMRPYPLKEAVAQGWPLLVPARRMVEAVVAAWVAKIVAEG